MNQQNINEQLMDAISNCNADAVKKCLANGANANYTLFDDADEPNGYLQPTTPLRLVMFRISDNLLTNTQLKQLAEITKLLLDNGANPKPAMQLAEWRYGKYNPAAEKSLFMEVWHLIAQAQ